MQFIMDIRDVQKVAVHNIKIVAECWKVNIVIC